MNGMKKATVLTDFQGWVRLALYQLSLCALTHGKARTTRKSVKIYTSLSFRQNWLACWLLVPKTQVRILLSTDMFLLLFFFFVGDGTLFVPGNGGN